MKNLSKLSIVAASLMLAGNALAVDDVNSGEGSVEVTGHVPVNCTVTVGEGNIDMAHNPAVGTRFGFGGAITFECNNKKGANITVTSSNGGLANEDSPEHLIDYAAWLLISGTEQPISGGVGGNFVELACVDGACETNTVVTGEKDKNLAMGMVSGELSVELSEAIKFAGVYSDSLTINISAKI